MSFFVPIAGVSEPAAALPIFDYNQTASTTVAAADVPTEFLTVGSQFDFSPASISDTYAHRGDNNNYFRLQAANLLKIKIAGIAYTITPSVNFVASGNYHASITFGGNLVLSGDATGTVAIGSSDWSGFGNANWVVGSTWNFGTIGDAYAL